MLGATTEVATLKKELSEAEDKAAKERIEQEKQEARVGEVQQGGQILFVANDKPGQFLKMRKAVPRTHGNYRQASFIMLIRFAFGTSII